MIASVVGAVLAGGVAGLSRGSDPTAGRGGLATDRASEAALRTFTVLVRRGEGSEWIVEYDSERRSTGGQVLRSREVAIRRADVALSTTSDALVARVIATGAIVDCSSSADGPRCARRADGDGASPGGDEAALIGGLVRSGAAGLAQVDDQTVGGEAALCFELTAFAPAAVESAGTRCLTPDGIPVASEQERGGIVLRRRARRVARSVPDSAVDAELRRFGIDDFVASSTTGL